MSAKNPFENQIEKLLSMCSDERRKRIIESKNRDEKRSEKEKMLNINIKLPYATMPDLKIYRLPFKK